MKKVWKKACSLALTVAVLSSYSLTANALGEETKKYETEKYLIEKVSNPTSGEGEVDGILTGQDHAREQSYSWSMIEYGDSIYIGTCYNPIAGIYYRNVISNLTSKGMDAEKAAKIASKLIELMYDGAMYTEGISQTSPVIVKVNKESYDTEIVYKYTAGRNNMAGYRMAAEFNDKLYFVGSGYPTNNLVEIDPINNTSNVVFESRKNIACRKAKEALDNLHGILQYAYEYWKHNFENRHYGSFLENELMEHWVLYEDDLRRIYTFQEKRVLLNEVLLEYSLDLGPEICKEINNYCNYLLSDFLRLAKNRPAAAIMITHPAIVKIVVPIPPVDGRAESFVSFN